MTRETQPIRWPRNATERAILLVQRNWWLIEKRRLLQRTAGRAG